MLKKIVNYFLGEACPECGSRHLNHHHGWIRGYNELCKQAAGAPGKRCYDCGHVIWDDTYEEYVSSLPDWVRPFPDKVKKKEIDAI
jgi:hypothetical protein